MQTPFDHLTDADLDRYIERNRSLRDMYRDPDEAGVYARRVSAAEYERARRAEAAA